MFRRKAPAGSNLHTFRHLLNLIITDSTSVESAQYFIMAWEEPRKTGMLYRRLGNSGLHVSAIALGGWLTFGGHVDDEKTFACMKQAYDLGVNFFDTADSTENA